MNFVRAVVGVSFVVVTACSSEQKAAPTTSTASATPVASAAPAPAPSAEPAPTGRPRRKEGEMCGGIAGLRCDDGLDCVIPEPMHPDKSGKCTKR